MKTKTFSALEQKTKRKKLAAQRLTNSVLPAGRLDGSWAIELTFAEQGKDQSHQFAGGEHEGAFMFVFRDLLVFGLVECAVSRVVHPQRVSGFDEVVAQVRIGGPEHSAVLGIEVPRLMLRPDEAGHLGDGVVIRETADVSEFGHDPCREHGPHAGEAGQGIGKGLHQIGDGFIDFFDAGLQASEGADQTGQDEVLGSGEFRTEPERFPGRLMDFLRHGLGIGEPVFALFDQERHEVFEGFLRDVFGRHEFLDQGQTRRMRGMAQWVLLSEPRVLKEQVREEMPHLALKRLNGVVTEARETLQGNAGIAGDMGNRELGSHAQEVSNDRGIHFVGFYDFAGPFVKPRNTEGIEPMDARLALSEERGAGGEVVRQVPVVEGRGFQTDHESIISPRSQSGEQLSFQGFGAFGGVREGLTFSERSSIVAFHVGHERLTGDINAGVQGFHMELPFLERWESSRGSESPGTWRPRSLAKASAVTGPVVDTSSDGNLPAEEGLARTTGCAAACVVSIQVLQAGPADFRSVTNTQGDTAESSSTHTTGWECSGILHEHSTGTSENCRRHRTLKARAIASVKSNACVTEMSFHPYFQTVNFSGGSERQRHASDFLTSTAYC